MTLYILCVGIIYGLWLCELQYEGAAKEDGRGPSIWDIFTHKYPGLIFCYYLFQTLIRPYLGKR